MVTKNGILEVSAAVIDLLPQISRINCLHHIAYFGLFLSENLPSAT